MRPVITLIIILLFSQSLYAQDCTCKELLDSAIIKTESNYAGYQHKINARNRASYNNFKKGLLSVADRTSFLDCYDILNRYVKYFNDGHLFISEFPRATAAQSDSLAKTHPRYVTQGTPVAKQPDQIEGVWQNAKEQLEIVRITDKKFYAVIKKTTTARWQEGMIKMEITKGQNNKYSILFYNPDFTFSRFSDIGIFKRLLLGFGSNKYVKLEENDPEMNYIHVNKPEQPFFKVIDKDNVLLTVPSSLISQYIVDSILMKNKNLIVSAKNFILDLRSNTGGNYMWNGIQMLANTKPYLDKKDPTKDDFLMLASLDNAAYFENFKNFVNGDTAGIGYYTRLTNKIKNNLGATIGFSFYSARPSDTSQQTILPNPKNVAIIIDKGVASAAEAVINSLKSSSTKVIVYGENSHGMIDYVNVNTIRLKFIGNKRYYFGYPTFYSPDMLKNPINPTGIKPDVYIPNKVRNWIEWVIDDLKKKKG
ncbi:hypothetical protein KACHI17_02240 [Sediminibacterium sp. KACHI17]|uniref:Tail specific protease domain-containing protein n=1 Tax=Sediminibacterium sp. KACHI17 TaxID=1751071 RepID=A0AAT9GFA7_9BACT